MRVILEPGAYKPMRAHATDAGLDIRTMFGGCVPAGGSATFRTGVHIELPPGTAGVFVSKSGLMMRHDITSTGLVDEEYQGEIMVKLFNHGREDYKVSAGDKISQLVVVPVRYEIIEAVEDFGYQTGRANSGFGSTGK